MGYARPPRRPSVHGFREAIDHVPFRVDGTSRDRVRAIVINPLVEDTARIDTVRFEIEN